MCYKYWERDGEEEEFHKCHSVTLPPSKKTMRNGCLIVLFKCVHVPVVWHSLGNCL